MKVFRCTNCLNVSTRPRISFDERGWCNACQWSEEKKDIDWEKRRKELYKIVHCYNGSFSAEHGIGQLKKDSLKTHKDEVAYSIMGIIKNQLDPQGIMNPGKVLF